MLQVFFVVWLWGELVAVQTGRAAPRGRQTGVLRVEARWGVLVLSRSSRLPRVAHVKSRRERRGLGEGPAGAETETQCTSGRGGLRARPSGRRALAMPLNTNVTSFLADHHNLFIEVNSAFIENI
jgi:hypothetical protein